MLCLKSQFHIIVEHFWHEPEPPTILGSYLPSFLKIHPPYKDHHRRGLSLLHEIQVRFQNGHCCNRGWKTEKLRTCSLSLQKNITQMVALHVWTTGNKTYGVSSLQANNWNTSLTLNKISHHHFSQYVCNDWREFFVFLFSQTTGREIGNCCYC